MCIRDSTHTAPQYSKQRPSHLSRREMDTTLVDPLNLLCASHSSSVYYRRKASQNDGLIASFSTVVDCLIPTPPTTTSPRALQYIFFGEAYSHARWSYRRRFRSLLLSPLSVSSAIVSLCLLRHEASQNYGLIVSLSTLVDSLITAPLPPRPPPLPPPVRRALQ